MTALALDGDAATNPTVQQIEDLGKGFLASWIEAIDNGVRNWPVLGLATTKALFDADNKRFWQNEAGANEGADVDPARAEAEGGISYVDAILAELDDPNHDGSSDDSFITRHLAPMLGVPSGLADIGNLLGDLTSQLDELVLPPFRFLLNPLSQAIADVKAVVRGFIEDIIRDRFGVDIEQFELLLEFGTKMDVASINGIPIFKPGDREKMDGYLGIVNQPSPLELPLDLLAFVEFYPGASGGMHPNVENVKSEFKPFANALVVSKMLLLQETNPLGGAALGQLTKLARDGLAGVGTPMPTYDWGLLNIVGAHGGSVMTTTLPIASVIETFDPTTAIGPGGTILLGASHALRTMDAVVYDPGLDGQRVRYAGGTLELSRRHVPETGQRPIIEYYFVHVDESDPLRPVTLHLSDDDAHEGLNPLDLQLGAATGIDALIVRTISNQEILGFPDGVLVPTFDEAFAPDQLPWLRLIDGNGVWRIDGRKTVDLLYRVHQPHDPSSGLPVASTTWTAVVAIGEYRIFVSWLFNVTQRIDGEELKPATNARYEVFVNGVVVPYANDTIDQRKLATCYVDPVDFVTFDPLGGDPLDCRSGDPDEVGQIFVVTDAGGGFGTLAVRLTNLADGDVIAGPVRIVPVDPANGLPFRIQRIVDPYTLAVLPSGQTEQGVKWLDVVYASGNGNFPLWESELLRPVFRAFFDDWQNFGLDFPELGDATSPDPNTTPGLVPEATHGSWATPFEPLPAAEPPVGVEVTIASGGTHTFAGTIVLTGVTALTDVVIEVAPVTTGTTTIGADFATNSFTRAIGSFVLEGFLVGQQIVTRGFDWNSRTFTVTSVTDFALTVAELIFPGDSTGTGDEVITSPGRITLAGNIRGPPNLTINAQEIVVLPGVVVTTRQLAVGGDPFDDPSIADSGHLVFAAERIEIGPGAALLTFADSGFAAGDVILDADADGTTFFDVSLFGFDLVGPEAVVEIGAGALIRGRDVIITADATSTGEADLADGFAQLVAVLDRLIDRVAIVPQALVDFATLTVLPALPARFLAAISDVTDVIAAAGEIVADAIDAGDLLDFSELSVEGVYALATARTTVGDGAVLLAARDISITAEATASATNATAGRYLALSYANARPTASAEVRQGSELHAGQSVLVSAATHNTIDLRTDVSNAGDVVGFSLGFAKTRSIARTLVDIGAEVTAPSADFLADTTSWVRNITISSGFADSGLAGAGAAIAGGYYQALAEAFVAGTVSTTGDLSIVAQSVELHNETRSFANVTAAPGPSNSLAAINEFLASLDLSFTIGGKTFDPLRGIDLEVPELGITIGAALTFVETENRAAALLHEGAVVGVGGDLLVRGTRRGSPVRQRHVGHRRRADPAGHGDRRLGGVLQVRQPGHGLHRLDGQGRRRSRAARRSRCRAHRRRADVHAGTVADRPRHRLRRRPGHRGVRRRQRHRRRVRHRPGARPIAPPDRIGQRRDAVHVVRPHRHRRSRDDGDRRRAELDRHLQHGRRRHRLGRPGEPGADDPRSRPGRRRRRLGPRPRHDGRRARVVAQLRRSRHGRRRRRRRILQRPVGRQLRPRLHRRHGPRLGRS